MYCANCGNQLLEQRGFCGKCGNAIESDKAIKEENEKFSKVSPYSNTVVDNNIVRIISIIGGYFIARYLGFLITIIFFGAFLLGIWFPIWYLKRENINHPLIKWIVWSNIVSWFLPPLGIITGMAALGFSASAGHKKKQYTILAITGLSLALINAGWGIYSGLQNI